MINKTVAIVSRWKATYIAKKYRVLNNVCTQYKISKTMIYTIQYI